MTVPQLILYCGPPPGMEAEPATRRRGTPIHSQAQLDALVARSRAGSGDGPITGE